MLEVFIADLDKAEVFAALYNGARPQGMGFAHYSNEPMSVPDARLIISRSTSFDYVQGRVMKVNLTGDSFDPGGYDRDNGEGAAKKVIQALRATNRVNPEEIEIQHLEGTREAAKIVRDNLDTKTSVRDGEGDMLVISMGLEDVADVIKPKIDAILGGDE